MLSLSSPCLYTMDMILFVALFISVITDLASRKILNWVTLPTILLGLIGYTLLAGWTGFLFSGKGFLLGLGLLIVPYLLGGMGAGDVKLLAAIGALKGPAFVFSSFLYMSVFGGVIALVLLVRRRQFKNSVARIVHAVLFFRTSKDSLQVLDQTELHHAFPYGVAIGFGTLAAYLWGGL